MLVVVLLGLDELPLEIELGFRSFISTTLCLFA